MSIGRERSGWLGGARPFAFLLAQGNAESVGGCLNASRGALTQGPSRQVPIKRALDKQVVQQPVAKKSTTLSR
jgi:hypothetical protein